jgi:hypothetical protein
MRSKMKLWAAESRIFAQTDIKILLTKVDALFRQVTDSEGACGALQRQILALQASKLDLQAQMGLMVPVADLHSTKGETSKLREVNDGLKEQLRSMQAEIERLTSNMQVTEMTKASSRNLRSITFLCSKQ